MGKVAHRYRPAVWTRRGFGCPVPGMDRFGEHAPVSRTRLAINKEGKMLSLPKIIAPVDFSERSPGAARYAGRMACHFRSELTLLHVLDSSAYDLNAYEFSGPIIGGAVEDQRRQAEAILANFLPGEFRNMNVRRVVL